MSIKRLINHNVERDLVVSVIANLNSISSSLDAPSIEQIVSDTIKNTTNDWKPNNDLGMIADRYLTSSYHTDSTGKSESEIYSFIKSRDEIAKESVSRLASQIASSISSALYTLRTDIKEKTNELVAKINTKIIEMPIDTFTTHRFDWGNLKSATFNHAAIHTAQELTKTFKNNTATAYDSTKILLDLPVSTIKELKLEHTAKLLIDDVATFTMNKTIFDKQLFFKVLTNANIFKSFFSGFKTHVGTAHNSFTGSNLIGSITILDMFNAFLSKLENTKDLEIPSAIESDFRNNLAIFKNNLLLAYASLIYPRHFLTDRVIISESHINEDTIPSIIGTDISENDITNHMRNAFVSKRVFPKNGYSVQDVNKNKQRTINELTKYDENVKKADSDQHRHQVVTAFTSALKEYYNTAEILNMTEVTKADLHDRSLESISAKLNRKDLSYYDIATEYFVTMSGSKMVKSLYNNIKPQMNELIVSSEALADDAAKKKAVDTIICKSITKIIHDFLIKNFSIPHTVKIAA
jgi:hypothetical protein